jgi:hypothetical protein
MAGVSIMSFTRFGVQALLPPPTITIFRLRICDFPISVTFLIFIIDVLIPYTPLYDECFFQQSGHELPSTNNIPFLISKIDDGNVFEGSVMPANLVMTGFFNARGTMV